MMVESSSFHAVEVSRELGGLCDRVLTCDRLDWQRNTFLEAARPVLGPNGIIRQCFSQVRVTYSRVRSGTKTLTLKISFVFQLAMSASVPLEQLLNPDVQPSQYELSRLALDGGLESMDLKNAVAWLER